jgi:hypothetical protein
MNFSKWIDYSKDMCWNKWSRYYGYVAAAKALTKKESHYETQFTIKIAGKTSLGSQLFRFVKFSFPVTCLMPYYAETDCSRPVIAELYW